MAYYLKLSSMALSGCKPKLFCNTARIASALCSVKSIKYIRSNAASLNAADKKRRKCTLIPEDGVGPELVHSVLEVYKGVIDSFETVTAKKSFAFDYAIKNNRKKVTAVHKAFIMSHRFYSNSANEPDESSEPKIQVDGVMILDHTKNSKQSQLCEVKNVVNNLYCYLNVRLLHMRSTLQAFNGQMTVDFEEKLKLNELPCSVKEKLESARKLYVNDMSYQAGFAQAEAVLLPELEARNNKLVSKDLLLKRVSVAYYLRTRMDRLQWTLTEDIDVRNELNHANVKVIIPPDISPDVQTSYRSRYRIWHAIMIVMQTKKNGFVAEVKAVFDTVGLPWQDPEMMASIFAKLFNHLSAEVKNNEFDIDVEWENEEELLEICAKRSVQDPKELCAVKAIYRLKP